MQSFYHDELVIIVRALHLRAAPGSSTRLPARAAPRATQPGREAGYVAGWREFVRSAPYSGSTAAESVTRLSGRRVGGCRIGFQTVGKAGRWLPKRLSDCREGGSVAAESVARLSGRRVDGWGIGRPTVGKAGRWLPKRSSDCREGGSVAGEVLIGGFGAESACAAASASVAACAAATASVAASVAASASE